jgi:GTP-binding protein LepA
VSRSLAACEGALLVVDAAQGVEAQSVANCYTAIEQGLEVMPVLNKIDLPSAEPERVKQEIEDIIGIEAAMPERQRQDRSGRRRCAGGDGAGAYSQRLAAIRTRRFKALIIDSWFDNYLGVVSLVRVVDGSIAQGRENPVMSTGKQHQVEQVGVFTPKRKVRERSGPAKSVSSWPASRRSTARRSATPSRWPRTGRHLAAAGLQEDAAAGVRRLFPVDADAYPDLREALEAAAERRLAAFRAGNLAGAGLRFPLRLPRPAAHGDRPGAAGAGIRLDLITTAPTVIYEVLTTKGEQS